MKRQKIILILVSCIFIILIILGAILNQKKIQNSVFLLTDIKLGKINPKSKEVLYTNSFLKGDEFLISCKNSDQKLSLKVILLDYNNSRDILLSDTIINPGDNEICCFDIPKETGQYDLKFITDSQETIIPFEVKDRLIEYQNFNLRGIGLIPYPNWQFLDNGIINNLLIDVFSYYFKDLGKGISTLLVLQDETGAQFTINQRIVSNYKDLPFGNIVQTIEENENKALLKARIIDDYTILNKEYGDREIYFKIRNISKGISYIVFNKTFLEKNFLNKKFLLSISLTCPERLVDFYQPVADYIFSNIKLTQNP
ncbi:MAG: hypothetical protein WC306_01055 [Candidatus Paceibacterota bacterium]|jgi:hypothetical protein